MDFNISNHLWLGYNSKIFLKSLRTIEIYPLGDTSDYMLMDDGVKQDF